MVATAMLISGKVKYAAGKPRQTIYGDRINVMITLSTGEDVRLWGNPGDPSLTPLRKGQDVSLMQNGKGYKLVSHSDSAPINGSDRPPVAPSMAEPVLPQDQDCLEIVTIFRQLRAALPECREDTVRAFTSTVFMQRCKAEAE
ncbi:hypothetical protein [Egbenema bharatensis]|uniref:hypothetical protein n=1 Tax=Egbenema bharatensis TaxID=3463334 RepID=UPI003A84DB60